MAKKPLFLNKDNSLNLKVVSTTDQSDTLYNAELGEHYHSTNGAINESLHVFINAGLNYSKLKEINLIEIGFGTGLNAILTFIKGSKKDIKIAYTSIELYPLDFSTIKKLNYFKFLPNASHSIFEKMHTCSWNKSIKISKNFTLNKCNMNLLDFPFDSRFDLVYFDAFAPDKQPELWSEKVFNKIYNSLNQDGILTTYSSKGMVKHNLRNAGFFVKRLEGPTGKRHMVRAVKTKHLNQ